LREKKAREDEERKAYALSYTKTLESDYADESLPDTTRGVEGGR